MKDIPECCVMDANVIFDLDIGGILEYPSQLGFSILIPDLVAHEIQTINQDHLKTCGMQIVELEEDQVLALYELRQDYLHLSLKDLSAFVLARETRSTLITGDGNLREMASKCGVECHGTLWIVENLVHVNILEGPLASQAVRTMLENGRWLPKNECELMIKKWNP